MNLKLTRLLLAAGVFSAIQIVSVVAQEASNEIASPQEGGAVPEVVQEPAAQDSETPENSDEPTEVGAAVE
ncbi:MAG: hypothetical protein L7U72_15295, partial [Rubripirellula sp.]|nr:hypothetical protein [Rubripirellula sp.]